MIDNEWYGNSTDEMFEKSSGYVGQGFKTLLKHFIASFFVLIIGIVLLVGVFFTICCYMYDQDKSALEYFETTDTKTVTVDYRIMNLENYYNDESELISLVGQRDMIRLYRGMKIYGYSSNLLNYDKLWEDYNYVIDMNTVVRVEELNSGALEAMDCSLVAGRLPSDKSEVAITKYLFDLYKTFGYKFNNQKTEVLVFDDVLGKTAFNRTIVGIVDTKVEQEVQDIRNMNKLKKAYTKSLLASEVGYNIHTSVFLYDVSDSEVLPSGWMLTLNHDSSDMILYELRKEYFDSNGKYCPSNKDGVVWSYFLDEETGIVLFPSIVGVVCVGMIFSAILAAGSFRDKKKKLLKMSKGERESIDFMGMFVPEIIIMLLSIALFSIISVIVGADLLIKFDMFIQKFFESGLVVGLIVDIALICVMGASAYLGVRKKAKKLEDINNPHKVNDKIEDKVVDRYSF